MTIHRPGAIPVADGVKAANDALNSPSYCVHGVRAGMCSGCSPVVRAKASAFDTQEGGDHYRTMVIQPMQYNLANRMPFAEGSVVKYVSRWRAKGGVADLRKAIQVLEQMIEHEERA